MSRWALYRQRYQRRRNAFILFTLSGAIRSADVEIAFFRERMSVDRGKEQVQRGSYTPRQPIHMVYGFKAAFL